MKRIGKEIHILSGDFGPSGDDMDDHWITRYSILVGRYRLSKNSYSRRTNKAIDLHYF